ncbi:3-oxoadipate enol-lactonase/4-carboxymuconolactone decarboxylase [Nocardiopsis sp. Huas11]|uniref:bifunctional 3-oxoadipate enol-lactonase/4-carboxymuconolactone decarboxylase PcaDC n=1 Tax=Nocardiopsis sp. Huas11 TaxID=2183912 RepID=UPI000EAE3240|nr:3-oxoadipate enol-lactonase [Nocardiopsis sp. Huas11]RKS09025.1 3-oxoadipate enol-lactonase/4-carboxymuconolactone decarboxylase [Nocardiopsis sp. Huas11]
MSVDLHYTDSGPADAPPVVLAGSLGATLDMWEPQVEALSALFRVIRIDHRGHGGSPVPEGPYSMADLGGDVVRLLDRLGIERAHFVGLSIGGMVGQWLALHAPERVDRLALLATSPHMGPAQNWRDRAELVRREGTGAVAESVVERWFTPDFAKGRAAETGALRDQIAATAAEGYAGCCGAIENWDVREDLARIQAPTLVVSGADDPAAPPAGHGALIAERVPGARLAVLDGAAHLLSWEQSAKVNTLLTAHLTAGDRASAGMRVRRSVLGDAHVDRAEARKTPFSEPFQDLITRYAWGEIWTRPGLDRRTRSCMVLTALVAHGHWAELAMHVRAALRNGLTRDEIGEVFLQAAIYCGVPAANKAFAVAQEVFAEQD